MKVPASALSVDALGPEPPPRDTFIEEPTYIKQSLRLKDGDDKDDEVDDIDIV